MPTLRSETISYLVAVAAQRTDIPAWRDWVSENEAELVTALSRIWYLRLKFSPEAELPRLLNELGVEYDSGLARHLRIAARGGAWGRSSTEEVPTLEVLLTLVHELAKSEDAERGQRLGELVLDAEHSMDDGYDFDALGVLRAVAALSTDDDLIATAVWHARQALLRG